MPRYAAVDIGSNSVRMMVAEVSPGEPTQILAEDRRVTRLGSSVFTDGSISPVAIDVVCTELARMAQVIQGFNASALRAVATSAVRDATNQAEFIKRSQSALGAPVEVISGQEEARLIHLGVQALWPHPEGRILIVDVGGGSTELILSEQGHFQQAYSKPLGAVRLTGAFLPGNPPDPAGLHRMLEYIDEKLAEPAAQFAGPLDRLIGTSATAAAIVSAAHGIPRVRRNDADRLAASTDQVREIYRQCSRSDLAARRSFSGIGPRRAEIIVAGSAVFLRVLEAFHFGAIHYSVAGVRDGIIADLAQRDADQKLARLSMGQRAVVEAMAARYGSQLPHVRQVAWLARELFQGLQPLHCLPHHYGKMLEAAAFVHDIGHFVSNTGHHKHSYYLVASSDMPGFTTPERNVIAWLCRYHRRALPGPQHEFFKTVTSEERDPVMILTPLLRLADSLDRSHEQRVRQIDIKLQSGQVSITLRPTANQDVELEIWAAKRNLDLFRDAYQVSLSIEAKP